MTIFYVLKTSIISLKGVVLSHHMILNNINQIGIALGYQKNRTVLCVQVPLYHCFGMVMGSLATVCHGATCVLPSPTFNAEESLKAIEKEK
jgi:acyl-CoA synthetase (AMP-forming)/AMP-acid ligase II